MGDFGPGRPEIIHQNGEVFRVWAPLPGRVEVEVDGRRVPMEPGEGGWWTASVDGAGPGSTYAFVLDGGEPRADPRSPSQPQGVFGPSAVVDHDAFEWTAHDWQGFDLATAVLYELHVGTFTPPGTFDGVIDKLDHLVDLGVTAVEVMPVAEFPGDRGWGYDGVNLYAPHHAYGGPDGLKRLVDACHRRSLGVVLDVVYNHLGPAGNHLAEFGPYFTDRFETPWGDAVNFAEHEVRRFVVDNALMWLRDYRIDALRLDAVHAIHDDSDPHILQQLAAEAGPGKHLIAESETIVPRLTREYGLAAQWHDEFHHAVHVALTGERSGYYEPFVGIPDIAAAVEAAQPPERFVVFAQNHDQVGNRAVGERLSHLVTEEQARMAAALVLSSRSVPLLFQGEEWAASTPFQYFTDHADPELGRAVSEGRRSEFGAFGWKPEDVPDPQDPATFERSRLDWSEPAREPHAGMLRWYRELIALRRQGLRCDVRPEG
ncbi:MAG: malto-oligosyltrehalose trehalohydrolase [Actinomycetota bacterium]|nr:malto-oligosyltrehalose trehalohydrolase [Actinomycetota bacterium]